MSIIMKASFGGLSTLWKVKIGQDPLTVLPDSSLVTRPAPGVCPAPRLFPSMASPSHVGSPLCLIEESEIARDPSDIEI